MIINPSGSVRAAVRAALAASFNNNLAEACAAFGLDAPAPIDFDNPGSNYFEARLSTEQLLQLEAPESWPAMSVYVDGSRDDREQKPRAYSGPVQITVRGFLRFTDADVTNNELWCDAFESAIIASLYDDLDGGSITYLAGATIGRGDLAWPEGANAWHQQIEAVLNFQIDV